jgi:hypothetical protein
LLAKQLSNTRTTRAYIACLDFADGGVERVLWGDAVIKHPDHGVVVDTEEERDRVSLLASDVCGLVNSGTEYAVGPEAWALEKAFAWRMVGRSAGPRNIPKLHGVADVDDKGTGNRLSLDPLVFGV